MLMIDVTFGIVCRLTSVFCSTLCTFPITAVSVRVSLITALTNLCEVSDGRTWMRSDRSFTVVLWKLVETCMCGFLVSFCAVYKMVNDI